MRTLTLERGAALVIVAHPDDETIWMGGTMLMNPHVRWTVFSLCRASDPDRAPKFRRVCRRYGAHAIITNLEDEGRMGVGASVPKIQRLIARTLRARRFDYVFTHGYNGEYGHARHVGVHRAVKRLCAQKKISTGGLLHFAYRMHPRTKIGAPRRDGTIAVRLPSTIFHAKRVIIQDMYGFKPRSFESRSAGQIETFVKGS